MYRSGTGSLTVELRQPLDLGVKRDYGTRPVSKIDRSIIPGELHGGRE